MYESSWRFNAEPRFTAVIVIRFVNELKLHRNLQHTQATLLQYVDEKSLREFKPLVKIQQLTTGVWQSVITGWKQTVITSHYITMINVFKVKKNFNHFTWVKRNRKKWVFSWRLKTGSDVADLISWGSLFQTEAAVRPPFGAIFDTVIVILEFPTRTKFPAWQPKISQQGKFTPAKNPRSITSE